ncbi:hypothetical protein BDP55DRAFT_640373 [Colletotrichum godetiae]|uniref:Uncharacterized protein n=1 Tax=Colletotrichum godetiae TaxID=1209918 RepID=A0AAJ0AZB8_9PEZI|nr:uncharacterized protein BDP55DRAFT_640373 [Colletotrichum godetiae]KAK1701066.1 hypothetical protein BDP55DRAFT_640373 [Colletotrichum godetiae]
MHLLRVGWWRAWSGGSSLLAYQVGDTIVCRSISYLYFSHSYSYYSYYNYCHFCNLYFLCLPYLFLYNTLQKA